MAFPDAPAESREVKIDVAMSVKARHVNAKVVVSEISDMGTLHAIPGNAQCANEPIERPDADGDEKPVLLLVVSASR